jgi:hypothetical protein
MNGIIGAQMNEKFTMSRAVPSAFAVLAFIGVLVIPLAESLYVFGHIVAIVSSLAAVTSFFVLQSGRKNRKKGFLLSVVLLGLISAATAGLLLSFGSKAGASGDIGGFPVWLLSTMGLLVLLMLAASEKILDPTNQYK